MPLHELQAVAWTEHSEPRRYNLIMYLDQIFWIFRWFCFVCSIYCLICCYKSQMWNKQWCPKDTRLDTRHKYEKGFTRDVHDRFVLLMKFNTINEYLCIFAGWSLVATCNALLFFFIITIISYKPVKQKSPISPLETRAKHIYKAK